MNINELKLEIFIFSVLFGLSIFFFILRSFSNYWQIKILYISTSVLALCYFFFALSQQNSWQQKTQSMYSLYHQGKSQEALNVAKELLNTAEVQFPLIDIRLAESVHHVGWLNWSIQNYKEAEKYFLRSLELYTNIENERGGAIVELGVHGVGNEYVLLAETYRGMGNKDTAIKYYHLALDYYEKNKRDDILWYIEAIKERSEKFLNQEKNL